MVLPLNLEDVDKWTNPCSDIGDVREFVSLPGACAILNEKNLKELIERNCHEKLNIETAKLIAKDSSLSQKAIYSEFNTDHAKYLPRIHKPGA